MARIECRRYGLSTEDKIALMKKKLAQRILVSATAGGVRDVETLKEEALRSLAGGFRLGDSKRVLRKLPNLE
jgi:deoxyribose-phosphate aldolase